jgi:hypothetical protein
MIPVDVIPLPTSPMLRESLVRFALAVGGPGAFERFAAADSLTARLEGAARMPVDSLVARWRAKLVAARSTSTAIDMTTALSSLFWVGVCACLALRSSRWR